MSRTWTEVATTGALLAAAADPAIREIVLATDLTEVPSFRLSPGQSLTAASAGLALRFGHGQHGLRLSSDNRLEGMKLQTDIDRYALCNDTTVATLGCLELRDLQVQGLVQILARDQVRSGHVEVRNVDIVGADARGYEERPKGFGVEVIPGAFTLWNQHADPSVTITASLSGLSAGRAGAPVRGSGIFVAGGGDAGGRLAASVLETGAVYSDGGIAPGTPDRITGGVFVVSGAYVDTVRNLGPVTTYGANDMVLDNWGRVDRWITEGKATSYGPSGIGFVNFGIVDVLQVNAPVETFGQGARGFNVYSGTVNSAEFDRVVTHADGAVGIQISQPVGRIAVRRGIETFGGTGDSLVKGVVQRLSAIALSVKPGGSAREVTIGGGLVTHGAGVEPLELHGMIASLRIAGGLSAASGGFKTI